MADRHICIELNRGADSLIGGIVNKGNRRIGRSIVGQLQYATRNVVSSCPAVGEDQRVQHKGRCSVVVCR